MDKGCLDDGGGEPLGETGEHEAPGHTVIDERTTKKMGTREGRNAGLHNGKKRSGGRVACIHICGQT